MDAEEGEETGSYQLPGEYSLKKLLKQATEFAEGDLLLYFAGTKDPGDVSTLRDFNSNCHLIAAHAELPASDRPVWLAQAKALSEQFEHGLWGLEPAYVPDDYARDPRVIGTRLGRGAISEEYEADVRELPACRSPTSVRTSASPDGRGR